MRKVLVPTDFSENAFNALKYASQVFKYERSEFFIVHAYGDEVYQQVPEMERDLLKEFKAKILAQSEQELKRVLERIMKFAPNPQHTFHILPVFGALIDEANDLVNQEDMDIVVMGTRGATNDRSLTFGSNTLQLLKYVHCPVLAIPEGYEYQAPKAILFPTNYLVPNKRRELKLLCDLTGSFRSTLHMLYIDPLKHLSLRQQDNKDFLINCLRKPKLAFETTQETNKELAIREYIEQHAINMLVMVNSRHSFMEDMLYQSTIDKISLHIKIPFLVLQNVSR